MANEFALSADGRIYQLSHRLGIHKAHFAGRMLHDWRGIVTAHAGCPPVI